ncbi:2,3-bisphosphoglycerate-dependent phosphoglycerate mutase [Paenibacillus catalpae]|uniref:2,3-bisphosphoglycerate-dependent phosphoglycerate mutase n=1 Tax=Paenibacillus catalpae TaxID=1045775 RepID=A0A1I2CY71_9BACL|nr:histidine phosphatase family protein [Paenibacillus catalpae]SFE73135.1 2,3-bisphosphoglycerate-dependent phosphoglycerate mutase [Paenibacillus catalpae]
MKQVYIVRHCKAAGQEPDAPLTETGAKQAVELAEFFSGKEVDFILSSPFERAYRTITPLADRIGLDVALDNRLAERVLSSNIYEDWRERLRKTYEELDLCYEGGESSNLAMSRAASVVTEALNSGKKNIVIVSHGNLISLLLKHFDNRIGFKEWEGMTNPDVIQLTFLEEDKPSIQRIWKN